MASKWDAEAAANRKGPPASWGSRASKAMIGNGLAPLKPAENGRDRLDYRSGGSYEGELKEGKRHGEGLYRWNVGGFYAGTWWENHMHGLGMLTFVHGGIYYGEMKLGKREGLGGYIFTSNSDEPHVEYLGSWKNDLFHGIGIRISKNGEYYMGQWKDGRRNGVGISEVSRGFLKTTRDGEWEFDEFNGREIVGEDFEAEEEADEAVDVSTLSEEELAKREKAVADREKRKKDREEQLQQELKSNHIARIEIEQMYEVAKKPVSVITASLAASIDGVVKTVENARSLLLLAKSRGERIVAKYSERAFQFDARF